MQTLDKLFGVLGAHAPGLPVCGIASDTREIGPGMIFVALRGRNHDGHAFIAEAAAAGAVAAVGELPEHEVARTQSVPVHQPGLPLPYLQVPNTRRALSLLAAAYHDYPTRRLYMIGVTGTKGKTTTSALTHHLLQSTGHAAGLLCTVGVWHGHERIIPQGHATTPEAPKIQATLAEWADRGIGYGVLETSSHALALHRVDDVVYDLTVWTTLHPEHLDFHGDMESYFQTKASLIERAPLAILNADCPYAMRLAGHPHISYGIESGELRATGVIEGPHSVRFTLESPSYSGPVEVPGIGRFNVYNALGALGAASSAGVPLEEAIDAVSTFAGVPGRMQIVNCEPVRIVVDFAHTPESLALALDALRAGTRGRLLVLTGAAGGRDPRKRVPIGRLALERADLVVFSEEDFGPEPLETILEALECGARAAGGRLGRDYFVIPDRTAAIRFLLERARPGDTILLAGKGHEQYLARESEEVPWDEVAEVRRWLLDYDRYGPTTTPIIADRQGGSSRAGRLHLQTPKDRSPAPHALPL